MAETAEKTRAPAGAKATREDGAGPAPTAARDKPLLTVPQQIEHLRSKGVTFELLGEAEAARMLTEEAPYFALACYRHLFERRVGGPRDGQYVGLDFGHLAALLGVDRALRAALLQASLDVEQAARARLNARMAEAHSPDGAPEDGYAVVEDYLGGLEPEYRAARLAEVDRLAGDEYAGAVVRKYRGRMPAWVYAQVASFGTLCRFYRFCADRWDDRAMRSESLLLRDAKSVRNACAHGSPIINGLAAKGAGSVQIPAEINRALADAGISHRARTALLANARMRHIASSLFAHSLFIPGRPPSLARDLLANIAHCREVLSPNNPVYSRLDFVEALTRALNLVQ